MPRSPKPSKARRAAARRPAPTTAAARLQDLQASLAEARERQTATSEILRVISQSPTDVRPVFDTIVRNAVQLCHGSAGWIWLLEGDWLRIVSPLNTPTDFPTGMTAADAPNAARVIREGVILNIGDVDDADDVRMTAVARRLAKVIGTRALLTVPLRRGVKPMGALTVHRTVVGAFAASQVELLETFADQAVIALENVRLFTAVETRNAELTEALDQQTATSDVLRVISSSPTAVQPVFDAIAASATRLCHGLYGLVFRFDGHLITLAAEYGSSPDRLAVIHSAYPRQPGRGSVAAQAILERRVIAIADAQNGTEFPHLAERARAIGYHSILSVPMLHGEAAIGAINVVRVEVAPFTDAQIALLKTFADQAVIAIENVRLFTELQERNREVERQSQQLAVASQHKSEFLANMSHELRTPLNAIIGFSEVLAERMFGDLTEKQDEYLGDIHASGQHLLSLINDILDLSKIEAGRMELEPADFDLPGAVDNALILVRERAGRRGITLGCDVDERVATIRGDERKVKQVLLNLLSNAIKFTPEGGRVDVRVALSDGLAEVSVTDTGIGIAPEDQEAVFEEFRQVGTAAKKVEGTGLGLALARKFIELHGGRLWVRSRIGEGSTFTFTIPVREATPGAP
jgi:signal transduction histidine kinase